MWPFTRRKPVVPSEQIAREVPLAPCGDALHYSLEGLRIACPTCAAQERDQTRKRELQELARAVAPLVADLLKPPNAAVSQTKEADHA